jgi:hypothetical protein
MAVIPAESAAREPEPMNTDLSAYAVVMDPSSRSQRSLGWDDGPKL